MKNFLVIILIPIFIFFSCTGLKEVDGTNVDIEIVEINSWLNLMPGGPGSFHLSGEAAIYSGTDNMIFNIDMKEVSVFTNNDLLYTFKPVFKYSRTEPDYSLNEKRIEVYQFYTESGLEIREVLMGDNRINVELIFKIDDEEIRKTMNDVEVTRAY
ncbi:MAG: hypothetical protein R6W68_08510 [Ignavibacteriaceae bacterium]